MSVLIQALVYCLFNGSKPGSMSGSISELQQQSVVRVKYTLYQLSEKYLSLAEQKQLVENLCYFQYSKSISHFLNLNRALEGLVSKIFREQITSINQPLTPI